MAYGKSKSLQSKDKTGSDPRTTKMKTMKSAPGWQGCNTPKGMNRYTKSKKMGYE